MKKSLISLSLIGIMTPVIAMANLADPFTASSTPAAPQQPPFINTIPGSSGSGSGSSGGATAAEFAQLAKSIQGLDADMRTGFDNVNQIQQNQVKQQSAANELTLPANLDFLWTQTGYNNGLTVSGNNDTFLPQTQYNVNYVLNDCFDNVTNGNSNIPACNLTLQDFITGSAASTASTSSSLQLLQPQTMTSSPTAVPADQDAANLYNGLTVWAQTQQGQIPVSGSEQTALETAATALSQVAANNTANSTTQTDSQMSELAQAVNLPFALTSSTVNGKQTYQSAWFESLNRASTPQVLRAMAIMMALNNYIDYQRLKAQQTGNVLKATEVTELAHLNYSLGQLNQAQSSRYNQFVSLLSGLIIKYGNNSSNQS